MIIKKKTNFELKIKNKDDISTYVIENVKDFKNVKEVKIIANINLSRFFQIEKVILVEEKLEDDKKQLLDHKISANKVSLDYLSNKRINELIESFQILEKHNNKILQLENKINILENNIINIKDYLNNESYNNYINKDIDYLNKITEIENYLYRIMLPMILRNVVKSLEKEFIESEIKLIIGVL